MPVDTHAHVSGLSPRESTIVHHVVGVRVPRPDVLEEACAVIGFPNLASTVAPSDAATDDGCEMCVELYDCDLE